MNHTTLIAAAVLALTSGLAATAGLAQETPCQLTARDAAKACRADADEEYLLAQGVCRNFGNKDVRSECRADAEDTRDEDLSECNDARDVRFEVCDVLDEFRYNPPWRPADFVDPDAIGDTVAENPYLSLIAGKTWLIVAGEEQDETVVEYVTEDTRRIGGVECRVVKAVEFDTEEEDGEVEYELTELTDDWYAQHVNGDVWYCGELARNYEDGELADLEGSFEAFEEGAKPGILLLANPQIGDAHRQEWFLGEAEDTAEVLDTAGIPPLEVEGFECAPGGCLVQKELNPDDPGVTENKYFLAGTGFVQATEFEDDAPTADREELVCAGDTLESCVTDPALLEALCEADPDTFEGFCP